MNKFIDKIRGMPVDVLIKKVYLKIYLYAYHYLRALCLRFRPIELKSALFKNYCFDPQFLFDSNNRDYYVQELKKHNQVDNIIHQANKIIDHTFDILGSGSKNLGKNIPWNQDFISGHTWENKYYKKIKIIDYSHNGDPKVPWELSRFQHIPILGQAYWITNDGKYLEEFKYQLKDWISKNPVDMSINWTYAMDVAIRACNWIVGLNYFNDDIKDSKFTEEINATLYLHGDFIYRNLEKSEINNNHYISDLVGLIWLGIYFKNFKYKNESEKWLEYAISELEIEMSKQVYSDGFDYEASTAYHCLVTELLLYTSILCEKNNIIFSESYNHKLEKMCEVIMNITKPNGLIPLIGDMDSGRFIMLTGYGDKEMRDFLYLLGVAGEYFDRDDFKYHASNQLVALWMFPELECPNGNIYPLKSATYHEGGIHILRNEDVYLAVRCGQNGTARKGGHTHNDQLSFELNINGEDFIVDPGTYVYTSNYEMRNLFRSTKYHNTLQIEDYEQNNFDEFNLFSMRDEAKAKVIDFTQTSFVGEHYGFVGKSGVVHRREIQIYDNKIMVIDSLNKDKPANIFIRFHLASNIEIIKKNKSVIMKGLKSSVELVCNDLFNIQIEKSKISKKYGEIIDSKTVLLSVRESKIFKVSLIMKININ